MTLAVAIGLSAGSLSALSDQCSDRWVNACSVTNSGSQLDLSAKDGTDGSSNRGSNSGGRGPSTRPTASPTPSCIEALGCRQSYSVAIIPSVTVEDLASFRPAEPSLSSEPAGFAVRGLPANFVSSASEQIMTGELLDWDVTVRFTPAAYVFHYVDGTSSSSPTGGSAWEATGVPQFTPTSTSHIYRARGSVTPSVTVQYAASVDFGTGWRDVPGFVQATATGGAIDVLDARTALVERTCAEDPAAAGCERQR